MQIIPDASSRPGRGAPESCGFVAEKRRLLATSEIICIKPKRVVSRALSAAPEAVPLRHPGPPRRRARTEVLDGGPRAEMETPGLRLLLQNGRTGASSSAEWTLRPLKTRLSVHSAIQVRRKRPFCNRSLRSFEESRKNCIEPKRVVSRALSAAPEVAPFGPQDPRGRRRGEGGWGAGPAARRRRVSGTGERFPRAASGSPSAHEPASS